jgi:hypothetical protein
MNAEAQNVLDNFKANIESVRKLAKFDLIVLDYAIHSVESCIEKLRQVGVDNRTIIPVNTLTDLRNARKNKSLRPQYQDMFNQCIVLLVSHFGYSLEEILRVSIEGAIPYIRNEKILSERLHISVSELQKSGFDLSGRIGEWIIRKKDISFQDMQSIRRTFSDYFNIELEKDADMNNIIFAQASRHIIAHAAGVLNEQFTAQIKDAYPRTVKPTLEEQNTIQFDPAEIEEIAASMLRLFGGIVSRMKSVS